MREAADVRVAPPGGGQTPGRVFPRYRPPPEHHFGTLFLNSSAHDFFLVFSSPNSRFSICFLDLLPHLKVFSLFENQSSKILKDPSSRHCPLNLFFSFCSYGVTLSTFMPFRTFSANWVWFFKNISLMLKILFQFFSYHEEVPITIN